MDLAPGVGPGSVEQQCGPIPEAFRERRRHAGPTEPMIRRQMKTPSCRQERKPNADSSKNTAGQQWEEHRKCFQSGGDHGDTSLTWS